VAFGSQKKPLDFGGNPGHVTLWLQLGGCTAILRLGGYVLSSNWMAPWKNRTSQYISFSAHHSVVFYFRCSVY